MQNMVLPLNTKPLWKGWFGSKLLNGFGFILFFASCQLSSSTMTRPSFEKIALGTPIVEVEERMGVPYEITDSGQNQVYRYLERIVIGPGRTAQNQYLLIVKEGRVIDKTSTTESSGLDITYR